MCKTEMCGTYGLTGDRKPYMSVNKEAVNV